MKVKLPKRSPSVPPLHIKVELQITTDDTFEHYRYVHWGRDHVKFEEVQGGVSQN